ncbi:hypothetical protein [Limnoglobus roseus]|uniref:Uncharacterized protein n=1 Tax=Limnoglobus roseus TaxID=2598579 RepID=A0A5C1ANG9_9BACT|nr:hypothetical protein [Limnoglobus roseus]QEL19282.1 hypothetical protein PX52LOC_06345 [Limnoglobus roseus]
MLDSLSVCVFTSTTYAHVILAMMCCLFFKQYQLLSNMQRTVDSLKSRVDHTNKVLHEVEYDTYQTARYLRDRF